ncbi:hypothetical protein CVIRNUC_002911 [Coccomyxa viridis]|uniref:Fumarylacetoacetase n=1 Tax=Coccomyxa viridis TaxID=1274662 RepID=A0AAV1HYL3_9CHLO|nr:hypothetical protein CVIRNUC_002911 [Coccomyxa viridis]
MQDEVEMHLPVSIGDYTDFYLSREHATNCGTMLRGATHALSPNWGQILEDAEDGKRPAVMPCQVLDFELEMAALMGLGNDMGTPVPIEEAEDQIFGMVLLNDWSARDIQKWEMAPLGPFNSKNWASSISPWVVTMDALAPFKCAAPRQAPPPLPYLQEADRHTFDICLEAALLPAGASQALTVTRSNFKHLYWTLPQMVAHHTVGGCNLRPGDLLGTGTISCDSADKQGLACLLEKTWNGTQTLKLENGTERTFLEDGDTVILRGHCQGDGYRVGFGECKGQVLPCRGG